MKEEINILNNKSDFLELKNTLKKFLNTTEIFINTVDQAKEKILELEN